ncbi:MAG: MFS transporter [Candidatus Accumulibacter sp.]|jgi:MFS family permease|nr:MFS transporter [Accumulibacter sp.]
MINQTQSNSLGVYWHKIVGLLCFGWVSIWIYRTVLTPIYGEMQATIGITSDASMGAIASIYFFSYTGMQIPSGFLVDRFGIKAVLVPGFTLFAVAAILIGSANSLEMIYLGSLCAGLGTGAYYGSAYSLSGRTVPQEKRNFSNAIINSGSAVGMAIGLIGSSWLVKSLGLPWNIMLYIISGIILAAMICFIVVIKPQEVNRKEKDAQAKGEEPEDLSTKTELFSPLSISYYLLYFATCYGYYMLVTWLPNFLETERGFTGMAIGMSSALVAFASIPGALFFSRLADRFRSRRLLFIVSLEFCAALMLVLVVASPSSALLLLGLLLYGLTGKLAVDPMLVSLVTENSPRRRLATHLTTFNFCGMCASVAAPLLTGLISDQFHSKIGGFYLSVFLLAVCTVFFLLINRRRTPAESLTFQ